MAARGPLRDDVGQQPAFQPGDLEIPAGATVTKTEPLFPRIEDPEPA